MRIQDWLKEAVKKLDSSSVPTSKLDAEILLADSLNVDRSWIHAHQEHVIDKNKLEKLNQQIRRRATHEPLAYIRSRQEFYGREFIVSPDTLTPRPETETMIDLLLKYIKSRQLTVDDELQIIDVGTGSGCIIITSALELIQISNIKYQISYLGLDISEKALKISKKNSKNLKTSVKFKKFDLLNDSLTSNIKYQISNIVLANLPYVPDNFKINLAASHEPKFAIFGGIDGLDYYRKLFNELKKISNANKPSIVFTESLPPQHNELLRIANNARFELIMTQDLIQVFQTTSDE